MMPFEPPPPEILEQMRRVAQAEEQLMIRQRENVMAWPMIFCDCSARWLASPLGPGRSPSPAQSGCLVHGTIMVTKEGRVL